MIVELQDDAFVKAKNGDVFIIEEKNGKKYAKPISKKEFFKTQNESLAKMQTQVNDLQKTVENQNKKIDEYTNSIYKFIKILKGENTNEENV